MNQYLLFILWSIVIIIITGLIIVVLSLTLLWEKFVPHIERDTVTCAAIEFRYSLKLSKG